MEILKEYIKYITLSILIGIIITCLIGVLLAYTSINDNMMGTLIFVGIAISILSSSMLLNRKIKKRGYLYGLIFGMSFFLLIYTFSALASSALIMNTTVLVYLIMSVITRSYRWNNWSKHLREMQ